MEQRKFSKLAIHFSSVNLFHEASSFCQEIWTNEVRAKIDSLPGGINLPPGGCMLGNFKISFIIELSSIVLPFVSHSLEGIDPFPWCIMAGRDRRSFTEQVDCAEEG